MIPETALTLCDQCNRGIVPGPWPPSPCPICNGLGSLTPRRLAKILDLDESTVKGFWMGRRRTRKKTLEKILQKACQIIEPKRAKQLPIFEPQRLLPPQFLPHPRNDT